MKKLIGKQLKATINYDWENAYNPRMPVEVGQYETTRQYLKYDKDCFLQKKVSRFGFIDTLNRYHWAKAKYVRRLNRSYAQDFFGRQRKTDGRDTKEVQADPGQRNPRMPNKSLKPTP